MAVCVCVRVCGCTSSRGVMCAAVQLTDLGTNQQYTAVGTTQYMAPEVMQEGGSYGRKVCTRILPVVAACGRCTWVRRATDTHPLTRATSLHAWQADIWSLGITILEMATGSPPWPNPAHAVYKICMTDELPPIPDELSPDAHDFLTLVRGASAAGLRRPIVPCLTLVHAATSAAVLQAQP